MKIVLVEWEDSNIIHGWRDANENGDTLAHCKTVGFLKSEDDKKIVLAMGVSEFGSMIECITIPKGCLKSMKEMRVK